VIDWGFLASSRVIAAVAEGLELTLLLTILSSAVALVIGIAVALAARGGSRMGRSLAAAYVTFFRNVPLLVVLFFLYFGLPSFLPRRDFAFLYRPGYEVGVAVAAIALVSGAFLAEVLRAGIEAVARGQTEAARALGLRSAQSMRLVVWPQLLPIVLPGLCNEAINVVKNGTYAMTIGVTELIWQGQQIEAETFKGFEAMTVVTLAFLALNGSIFLAFAGLERACRLP
jgi:His/Glu/Gln/Arg/opine family amino acid ABC transporter permease subunit